MRNPGNSEERLSEFAAASEDALDSLKEGVEASWDKLRSSFRDAISKFEK